MQFDDTVLTLDHAHLRSGLVEVVPLAKLGGQREDNTLLHHPGGLPGETCTLSPRCTK